MDSGTDTVLQVVELLFITTKKKNSLDGTGTTKSAGTSRGTTAKTKSLPTLGTANRQRTKIARLAREKQRALGKAARSG